MKTTLAACVLSAGLLFGCSSNHLSAPETVPRVELPRFMGTWFVIAAIPTPIEDQAFNAIESYALLPDGSIGTTFTFRDGGFDGTPQRYTPTGFVVDRRSNAIWDMQFLWPFRAEYRISYLDPDYQHTIIARTPRDYVWIMARTPLLDDAVYGRLVAKVAALGYQVDKLRKVPQRWPD